MDDQKAADMVNNGCAEYTLDELASMLSRETWYRDGRFRPVCVQDDGGIWHVGLISRTETQFRDAAITTAKRDGCVHQRLAVAIYKRLEHMGVMP